MHGTLGFQSMLKERGTTMHLIRLNLIGKILQREWKTLACDKTTSTLLHLLKNNTGSVFKNLILLFYISELSPPLWFYSLAAGARISLTNAVGLMFQPCY